MKAENVRVGQRVRVRWAYRDGNSSAAISVVMEVRGDAVRVDSLIGWFHCSQLRLLKPKKKQPRAMDDRRWWVNIHADGAEAMYNSKDAADRCFRNRTEVWELAIVARHPVYNVEG